MSPPGNPRPPCLRRSCPSHLVGPGDPEAFLFTAPHGGPLRGDCPPRSGAGGNDRGRLICPYWAEGSLGSTILSPQSGAACARGAFPRSWAVRLLVGQRGMAGVPGAAGVLLPEGHAAHRRASRTTMGSCRSHGWGAWEHSRRTSATSPGGVRGQQRLGSRTGARMDQLRRPPSGRSPSTGVLRHRLRRRRQRERPGRSGPGPHLKLEAGLGGALEAPAAAVEEHLGLVEALKVVLDGAF